MQRVYVRKLDTVIDNPDAEPVMSCEASKPAIVVYGKQLGRKLTVCTDKHCPVHDPQAAAEAAPTPPRLWNRLRPSVMVESPLISFKSLVKNRMRLMSGGRDVVICRRHRQILWGRVGMEMLSNPLFIASSHISSTHI